MTPSASPGRRQQVSTAVGLGVGGLAFWLTLLDYGRDLTRTALAPGYFSQFFDLQARALLAGRLSVPDGSLGIEGFLHDGRTYTYFPPWPALVRMPVLLTTEEFDGRLTLLSMALAWVLLAVMVTKLVWLVVPLVTGTEDLPWWRAALVAAFLAAATGGTTLTYDAGLPWVYHEVYLWAVAGAVGAMYWMVRVGLRPDRHATKWLLLLALVAVGSRATEGWAVCLVALGMAAWMRLRPRTPEHRAAWRRVGLAGAVPLAVSILVNELKFGTVYIFPLQDQVWTQISEQRQAALAANGGSLTGPQFFTTSFMAYFRPDGIRFVDYFPWVTLPARAAPAYDGAVVDQSYRTGSITTFSTLLFVLLAVALVAAFRPRAGEALRLLRWPLVAGILVTGGVMGYGYYSMRYTSDFVPALVVGGAVGLAVVLRGLDRRARWRVPALGVVVLGAAFALVAQMTTGLASAAYLGRGETLQRYVDWQHTLSPQQQAALVSRVDTVPTGGRTDDLAVLGDCDALYLHTGDTYEPWVTVEERDRVVTLGVDPAGLRPGEAVVATTRTTEVQRLLVQVNALRQVRFAVETPERTLTQAWQDPQPGTDLRLGVRNRIDYGVYEIDSAAAGVVGYLPSFYLDDTEDSVPVRLDLARDARGTRALDALGLTLSTEKGFPLELCRRVAATAGLDVDGS